MQFLGQTAVADIPESCPEHILDDVVTIDSEMPRVLHEIYHMGEGDLKLGEIHGSQVILRKRGPGRVVPEK